MPVSVIDEDLGFEDFFKKADKISGRSVSIGYHSESGGFGVTELAIVHEIGKKIKVTDKMRKYLASQGLHLKKSTTTITIPARPFVRNSFDLSRGDIGLEGEKILTSYLDGKVDTETALNAWGDFYRDILRNGIVTRELFLEDNHPFTIERKGSDTPLVSTGEMLNRAEVKIE